MKNIYFSQYKHRKAKRELEMNLIISHLKGLIDNKKNKENINILEFGSGDGFQLAFLGMLGRVVGSDLENKISINIGSSKFVKCSITKTPFNNNFFKLRAWRKLFEENGCNVDHVFPLFFYGPSELPIFPIVRSKSFFCCSSVLFIMSKS